MWWSIAAPTRRPLTLVQWIRKPPVAAIGHGERLVIDEEADHLAVRDVDNGLTGLRVAIPGLGVGQRALLVDRVEIGAGEAVGLPLFEIPPQPDMPVGEGEEGFGL